MSLSINALKSVKTVVSHRNCPDGVASALILKDALPDARVLFMQHGTKEFVELPAEPGMLFVDFTPLENRAEEFLRVRSQILDHHPTQRDITMKFVEAGLGVFGLNDKNECGAWLAYTEVWKRFADEYDLSDDVGRAQVRNFAELAAVRDTWKTADPRWVEACEQAALLLFFPFEDLHLASFFDQDGDDYRLLGRVLIEKQQQAARKSIGEARRFTTSKGTRVLVFQGVSTTSDAVEIEEQFAEIGWATNLVVGFHYRVDAGKLTLQFSMRSHTGYDVGALAKSKPSGGGHRAAASFTVEVSPELSSNPYAVFEALLEEWEWEGRDG